MQKLINCKHISDTVLKNDVIRISIHTKYMYLHNRFLHVFELKRID
jgi:hypothetical protein